METQLIAFLCFTLFIHEGYPAAVSGSVTEAISRSVREENFNATVEYYKNVLTEYRNGRMNLKEGEERILKNKSSELEKLFSKMDTEFASFSEFMMNITQLRPEQMIKDLCIYGNGNYTKILRMLEETAEILEGPEHPFLRLAFKFLMKNAAKICLDGHSPRDYSYDFYNRAMVMEWKGYAMLSIFDTWWEAYHANISECSDDNRNKIEMNPRGYSSHEIRVEIYDNIFGEMMHWQKCIPEFHACDEYHELQKDIEIFKAPSALNEKIRSQALLYRSGDRQLHLSKYIIITNSL